MAYSEELEAQIRDFIREASGDYRPDSTTALFIDRFREIYGTNLQAVIYYGSKLIEGLAKPSSFRDFFVIVDNYGPIERDFFDKLTLPIMPPHMWFSTIGAQGQKLESKYHVLTLKEFRRYCSRHAPDHYLIGRLSKRVAVAWAASGAVQDEIVESLADAFIVNALRALPLLEKRANFSDAVKHFLAMSYRCELRLETPDKIDQLYATGKEFYDPLYEMLFDLLTRNGALVKKGDIYLASKAGRGRAFLTKLYILKSKFRHVARFPLMIRNMENWMDQLLGKYERTFGKKLDLTDFERRHKVLTALKYFVKIIILKRP